MSPQKITNVLIAEFVGTFILAFAMVATLIRTPFAFFSGIAAAVVYGLFVIFFGSKIVAHLNPAVTIGLWTVRKISTLNAFVYLVLQVAAGFAAWKLGQYLIGQTLPKNATGGFDWKVMIAEGIGALIFSLAVAAALNHSDKKLELHERSLLVGFGLFIGILVASYAVGGAGLINPAVAISYHSVSWAFVLGPIVGAILGFNLYELALVKSFSHGSDLTPAKKVVKMAAKPKSKTKK